MPNKDITKYNKAQLEELIEAFAAQGVVNSETNDIVSLDDFTNNNQRIEFVQAAIGEYGNPLAEDDGTESAAEAENRGESDENAPVSDGEGEDGAEDEKGDSDQSEGAQDSQEAPESNDTVPGTGRGEERTPDIKEYKGEPVIGARNKVHNGKLYVEIDTRNTTKLLEKAEYEALAGNKSPQE